MKIQQTYFTAPVVQSASVTLEGGVTGDVRKNVTIGDQNVNLECTISPANAQ